MKTILVTGGAGFIGGNFIRKTLAERDVRIVNLDALTYAASLDRFRDYDNDHRHTFIQGDICNKNTLAEILMGYKPDAVVHFAAQTHVDRSIDSPQDFIDSNIIGTYTLLELLRKCGFDFKLIHVSTDEVYGSGMTPFTEDSRYDPSSPYSASKAASDHLVRAYYKTYGLPAVITNCCNNYGPFQYPEKLIPLMIMNGIEGKPLPVYGSGGNIRDWIHVDDHVDALWTVIEHGVAGATYNIGADCEMSNLDVVHMICDILDEFAGVELLPALGYRSMIEFVDDRPGHDWMYSICNRKIKTLGWEPKVPFWDGLHQTVTWYYDNREWVSKIHDRRRLGRA